MKVLSLLQPWASLCVHTDSNGKALKQIETRSWNTKHRGQLLIHASKKPFNPLSKKHDSKFMSWVTKYSYIINGSPYGAIIGCVDLVGSFSIDKHYDFLEDNSIIDSRIANLNTMKYWDLSKQEVAFGDYSQGENRYGWLLSNPILFREPISCKGQLSIWNLPAELVPLVNRQIELI